MADEQARENTRELELYGELGLMPKVGAKLRFTRKERFARVINSAAEHANIDRGQLEDQLAGTDDRVRDVVAAAAFRAVEVDDEAYIDALSRLIAGALDSAEIDELAFVASEITSLEPVHLRALLGFFWFGREGSEAADADLGPTDAQWATERYRADREIAYLLKMARDSASQVLRRLDRDGLIDLHGGPVTDDEPTSGPSDWAGRVVSTLFPELRIQIRNAPNRRDVEDEVPAAPAGSATLAVSEGDPDVRARRAVNELVAEIKGLERQKVGPIGLTPFGGDLEWLEVLRRRLRRVDPDNPWAYEYDE